MNKRERKRPVLTGAIILIVLVTGGAVAGYLMYINSVFFESTEDASVKGDHVTVSSKILGRIKSLSVSVGDKVDKGQTVVELDDTDLRAQEKQAEASLSYAQQNAALAKISLDRATEDYNRARTLYNSGAATREQYEHARAAMESAKAQYSIAQAQVDIARAQLGVVQSQLSNTTIISPLPGTVASQPVMVGDMVQPLQPIMTINNLSNIWVISNFEETKIDRIRAGQTVDITVDAYPGGKFTGVVDFVSAGIVPPPFSIGEFTKSTQRIPVRINFTGIPEGARLIPGMSVEVKIRVAE